MLRIILVVVAALLSRAGSISGVVVDATGAVVARSHVVASSEGGSHTAITAEDGGFVVKDLTPGAYSIEISSPGFSVKTIKAINVDDKELVLPPVELSVAPGPSCGPFPPVCVLTPITSGRSQLAGRVFLLGNSRAAGALVAVYETKTGRRIASTHADSEGNFLITGLRPGSYQLRVQLSGYAELAVDAVELKRGFKSQAEYFNLSPCARGGECPTVKWVSQALCL
jgi:hypothetical protein